MLEVVVEGAVRTSLVIILFKNIVALLKMYGNIELLQFL